jgi:hypothetical protein
MNEKSSLGAQLDPLSNQPSMPNWSSQYINKIYYASKTVCKRYGPNLLVGWSMNFGQMGSNLVWSKPIGSTSKGAGPTYHRGLADPLPCVEEGLQGSMWYTIGKGCPMFLSSFPLLMTVVPNNEPFIHRLYNKHNTFKKYLNFFLNLLSEMAFCCLICADT